MSIRVLALLLALAAVGNCWGQQRTARRRQEVTIIATSKSGAPVENLSVEDISVFDNNVKQEITAFERITPGPAQPGEFTIHNYVLIAPGVYVDAPDIRLQIIRMADALSKTENLTLYVHDASQLIAVHRPDSGNNSPLRRFAAMAPKDLNGKLDLAAFEWLFHRETGLGDFLKPIRIAPPSGWIDLDEAVQKIALEMRGLPGRRNLFWIGSKFPLALEARAGLNVGTYRTARFVDAASVVVYPIEDYHLKGTESGTRRGDSAGVVDSRASASLMEDIAAATGGRSYADRKDVAAALREALEDCKGVYLARYTPSGVKEDGKLHDIRVTAKRKDIKLRYRRAYIAPEQ